MVKTNDDDAMYWLFCVVCVREFVWQSKKRNFGLFRIIPYRVMEKWCRFLNIFLVRHDPYMILNRIVCLTFLRIC